MDDAQKANFLVVVLILVGVVCIVSAFALEHAR